MTVHLHADRRTRRRGAHLGMVVAFSIATLVGAAGIAAASSHESADPTSICTDTVPYPVDEGCLGGTGS